MCMSIALAILFKNIIYLFIAMTMKEMVILFVSTFSHPIMHTRNNSKSIIYDDFLPTITKSSLVFFGVQTSQITLEKDVIRR